MVKLSEAFAAPAEGTTSPDGVWVMWVGNWCCVKCGWRKSVHTKKWCKIVQRELADAKEQRKLQPHYKALLPGMSDEERQRRQDWQHEQDELERYERRF